jgi:hypothetical protein
LAGLTIAYNGVFHFHHLTLKLDQVKHSSYTYIRDASLDKFQELNTRHLAYKQSNNPCHQVQARDAYSAAIASKLNVKQ